MNFRDVTQQPTKNFIEKYMDIPNNITNTGYNNKVQNEY